ncbi:hypothetical protein CCR80_00355 [Rhodothalassium salexigens]|uniref:phasin family protein n=1 Tax=Rhodothalassium salexigens TaxID=1086 RepID=UPI001A92A121|nr:phasin family protein [Rhodothalassium salexigens]MBK5919490.1 hypothetical protein [Rhodothalassium salexigens]
MPDSATLRSRQSSGSGHRSGQSTADQSAPKTSAPKTSAPDTSTADTCCRAGSPRAAQRPTLAAFPGLDFQTITDNQMRALDAARRMAGRLFDTTEAMTRHQAGLVRLASAQMTAAFDRPGEGDTPHDLLARQSASYGEMVAALSAHWQDMGLIAAETAKGLLRDASLTGGVRDRAADAPPSGMADKGGRS